MCRPLKRSLKTLEVARVPAIIPEMNVFTFQKSFSDIYRTGWGGWFRAETFESWISANVGSFPCDSVPASWCPGDPVRSAVHGEQTTMKCPQQDLSLKQNSRTRMWKEVTP